MFVSRRDALKPPFYGILTYKKGEASNVTKRSLRSSHCLYLTLCRLMQREIVLSFHWLVGHTLPETHNDKGETWLVWRSSLTSLLSVLAVLNSHQYHSFSSYLRNILNVHSFIWVLPRPPLIRLFQRNWCGKVCLNDLKCLEDFRNSALVSKMMHAPRKDSYLVRKETEMSVGMFDLCRAMTELQSPLQNKQIIIS